MWQSYAVKRQTIVMRDKDAKSGNQSRLERIWLFHGTDGDTVPKIVGMGFNRSFCGKNATAFGKGVYFARDASYSSSTTYSRPNSKGVQYMFLCRVVVGVYCKGVRDALTPDVRKGHQLYDSTVNDNKNPAIVCASPCLALPAQAPCASKHSPSTQGWPMRCAPLALSSPDPISCSDRP